MQIPSRDLWAAGFGMLIDQFAPVDVNCEAPAYSTRSPKIAWFKDPAGNILSVIEAK